MPFHVYVGVLVASVGVDDERAALQLKQQQQQQSSMLRAMPPLLAQLDDAASRFERAASAMNLGAYPDASSWSRATTALPQQRMFAG